MLITLFILFILMFVFGFLTVCCLGAEESDWASFFAIISLFIVSSGIVSTITYWCMS